MSRGRGGAVLLALLLAVGLGGCRITSGLDEADVVASGSGSKPSSGALATKVLATLSVKGRSAATGYDREEFGTAWKDVDDNGCDTRDDILRRDLSDETFRSGTDDCVVLTGTLEDPYTGTTIEFSKDDASEIQIDHVVALQNAWVTGAAQWSATKRTEFANDPLNLLAADGSANMSKGSGDAATWLPENKSFRCDYVARQVAVKSKYGNWVTTAEKKAISGVLENCPDERVPTGSDVAIDGDAAGSSGSGDAADSGSSSTDSGGASKGSDDGEDNAEVETPGAFCSPEGASAVDSDGDKLTCSVKGDDRARWRSAG